MVALKPKVVMLVLDVRDDGGDARLTVDELEVPRGAWHRPYASEPGTIDVVLAGAAGEDRRQLELEPGVAASVELRLAAAPPPPETMRAEAEPAQPAPAAPPASHAERSTTNTRLRVASYVTGFAVLGSMANSRFDALQSGCPERSACDPELRAKADEGERLQTAANVALVAGSVLVATGVTLFVLSLDQADEAELAVTGSGVTLRGAL